MSVNDIVICRNYEMLNKNIWMSVFSGSSPQRGHSRQSRSRQTHASTYTYTHRSQSSQTTNPRTNNPEHTISLIYDDTGRVTHSRRGSSCGLTTCPPSLSSSRWQRRRSLPHHLPHPHPRRHYHPTQLIKITKLTTTIRSKPPWIPRWTKLERWLASWERNGSNRSVSSRDTG